MKYLKCLVKFEYFYLFCLKFQIDGKSFNSPWFENLSRGNNIVEHIRVVLHANVKP